MGVTVIGPRIPAMTLLRPAAQMAQMESLLHRSCNVPTELARFRYLNVAVDYRNIVRVDLPNRVLPRTTERS